MSVTKKAIFIPFLITPFNILCKIFFGVCLEIGNRIHRFFMGESADGTRIRLFLQA